MPDGASVLSSPSRRELIAWIKEALERAKREGEFYEVSNKRFGLTDEQSKFIRGKGKAGVDDEVLRRVYRRMLDEGFLESVVPPKRSIYGFQAPYIAPPKKAFRDAHQGAYLTVGASTLSQSMFFVGITEITESNGDLSVTHKVFDKWEKTDEPPNIYAGHAYFVHKQIYMFLEAHVNADEIMTIVVNQSDMPPPRMLFGVYIGRGETTSSPSHPAAARVAFLRLDGSLGSHRELCKSNSILRSNDGHIRSRWVSKDALLSFGLPEPIITHLTTTDVAESGDYALRIPGASPRQNS
jgi:hypothetical protein